MDPTTGFFHDERCLWHSTQGLFSLVLPVGNWVQPPASAGLAESPESKRRAVSLMQVSGLAEEIKILSADEATTEDLLRVHPTSYLKEFEKLSAAGGGELGVTAPFGPDSFDIAKLSAGLAIQAVESVVNGTFKNAYSMSRPPGHHCLAEKPMGFCLLANIALAIEAAKAKHGIERIAVVDWDVHHGNGTQSIFFERSDVLTISMHQEGCFPPGYSGGDDIGKGQGEGYNINVPLLPGGGHEVYEYAMKRVVMPALNRYKPELIIVASGYDAGGFDPLGRMLLHSDSYRMLTETIMSAADIHTNGKLVLVHEGGYAESNVPFCVHAAIETLAQKNTDVIDPSLVMIEAWQPNSRVLALQKEMLDEIGMFHKL